ncbi:hypothetical protein IWQ62_002273 [Dispira parvispora]|uniref:Citrate transporter-like domain-containing protein n=1 Tax=Dispira parvispora TaxID=1520584 RepID=A0A9W8E2V5_9FUNG|nr:hypothetical protein IWQ62_002273 [Dispira parvispora]
MATSSPPELNYKSWLTLVTFLVVVYFVARPLTLTIQPSYLFHRISHPCSKTVKRSGWSFRITLGITSAPFLGVGLLWATQCLGWSDILRSIKGTEELVPYAVVILVFALAYICISLDLTGLLAYLAIRLAQRGKDNPRRLYASFYTLALVLAMFTSNDVVILTLTPILVYLCRSVETNPVPFLMAEFVAANTASIALYVGNPTNIVVAQAYKVSFFVYSAWMLLPCLASALVSFGVLMVVMCVRPSVQWNSPDQVDPRMLLTKPWSAKFGIALLAICLITLMVTSVWHVPVWLISLPFAAVLLLWDGVTDWYHTAHVDYCGTSPEYVPARLFTDTWAPCSPALDSSKSRRYASISLPNLLNTDTPLSQHSTSTDLDLSKGLGGSHPTITSPTHGGYISPSATDPLPRATPKAATLAAIPVGDIHQQPPSRISPCRRSPWIWQWLREKRKYVQIRFPTVQAIAQRLPWNIAVFTLSMFAIVEALGLTGWTPRMAQWLIPLVPSLVPAIYAVGLLSTLACNILNNLPMTILFVNILRDPAFVNSVDETVRRGCFFALVIGSNLGANLTFVGSLAGLIFKRLLTKHHSPLPNRTFIGWNLLILPFSLAAACSVLLVELKIMDH